MLLLDQLRFKVLAVFLVLALVMPMVMLPVGAVQAQEKVLVDFEQAIKISEKFLEKNPDGTLVLNMPREVIKDIGKDMYTQIQAGITQTNKMIFDGYLEFDENFNANVTEKYRHRVMTSISTDKQLKSVDVFSDRNTITMSSTSTGENKIEWYWWGFEIYLDDCTVDNISDTAKLGAIIAAFISNQKVARTVVAVLVASSVAIDRANKLNRGVILTFEWGLPPAGWYIIYKDVRSQ